MDFEIRDSRKPQGPRKLIDEREQYFRLVDQGIGYVEAARLVGINKRTGKRWRNGRSASGTNRAAPPITSVAPLPVPEPPAPSRYLNETERIHIADRLRENAGVRVIAAELGRSPSTISREIRRNRTTEANGRSRYRPHAAQRRAERRRPRPKTGEIGHNRSFGTSSRSTWPGGGARNRSATLCAGASPTGRRCTWSTRRSTRPSTSRAGEN